MNNVGELVISQAEVLATAFLTGLALCFFYDLIRVLRRIIPHSERSVGIEDMCYWIFWTLVVMVMLDRADRGMVRGFSLGGVGLGMLFYFFLISPWLLRAMVFVGDRIYRLLRAVLHILLYPFQKTAKFLAGAGRYTLQKGRCLLKKLKKASMKEKHEQESQTNQNKKKTDR